MRDAASTLQQNREAIRAAAARHGVKSVRVFGSGARGEADEACDFDFLVELEPCRGLLDLGGLLMDMRDLLGRRVDVITPARRKARIRDRVLQEAVPI